MQDIVEHDRWVLPRRNGELPSKPPLFHWIAALAAGPLGLSDATVRLPSALAAGVMAAATLAIGAATRGRLEGWLAAGALLGMAGFWRAATEARVDMVFAACVTVSLGGFLAWDRGGRPAARALCYLGAALAVLAKGPAGAVLPGLVILAFLALERRLGALRTLWSWRLAAAAAALDLGWYALAYRAGGEELLAVQVVRENVDRFVGRGVFGLHGGRRLLSLPGELATDLLPWSLVLPWALVRRLRGAREDATGRFLHVWWIAILAFFSLAFGKRSVYLLPLFPAVALLAGRALGGAVRAAGASPLLLGRLPVPGPIRRLAPGRPALALVAAAVAGFDLVLVLVAQVVREHEAREASLVAFADEVERLVAPDATVRASADLRGSDLQVLAYRLDRDIGRAAPALEGTPCAARGTYYLVPAETIALLAARGYRALAVSRREEGANVALVGAPAGCEGTASAPRGTAPGALAGIRPGPRRDPR